jgi:hypothetical protein
LTVYITDETIFKTRDGEDITFADLEIGRWVAGAVQKDDSDKLVARAIILMPEDFDPSQIEARRLLGEVQQVNNGQNTFTLLTERGEEVTIQVDENTRYRGQVSEVKDLEKGMRAEVVAVPQDDGTFLAKLVIAGNLRTDQRQRSLGKITKIAGINLTLETRDGEKTFKVSDETRFLSKDGSINGLEDLEEGTFVLVVYQEQDNGQLDALAIGAADRQALDGHRATGKVDSIGYNELTITTRQDTTLELTLTDETRFVSRDGEFNSRDDLEVGQAVVVVYEILDDGTLNVLMIALPMPGGPPPTGVDG